MAGATPKVHGSVTDYESVLAAVLIALPLGTALLAASSLRLESLAATLVAAYVLYVGDLGAVTWALSPLRLVTRAGVGVTEALLLAAAATLWWRRGRPGLGLGRAAAAARRVGSDPVTAVFVLLTVVLLAYELLLVATAPPNNWDSLTYHLARTAAWYHHHGIYEIPNVPSPNFNEFPPLAEQQVLYVFVATGHGGLFALPQYLAELALLVATYLAARRLRFGFAAAVRASALLATFSFVALQATTAQNDLFAASLPAAGASLLLGSPTAELALGGAAVAFALGAKPTTALVLPVVAVLALVRGRRVFVRGLAGFVAGFVTVGMWVYVLNLAHTGNVFGHGGWATIGVAKQEPIKATHVARITDVVYLLIDIAAMSGTLVHRLWIAGAVVAVAVFVAGVVALRASLLRALRDSAAVVVAFVAPVAMIYLGNAIAWFARANGYPVRGRLGNIGDIARLVPYASFGPIGFVLLFATPFAATLAFAWRRVDVRTLVLAWSLPVFLALFSYAHFNWFVNRFVLVPAALAAPVLAIFLRRGIVAFAFLVVSAISIGLVLQNDPLRPVRGAYAPAWRMSQVDAAAVTEAPQTAAALASYQRLVPAGACVGAILDPDEPAYLLSDPGLSHPVIYLPVANEPYEAYIRLVPYVVITRGTNSWAVREFRSAGWSIHDLGHYWWLAAAPHAGVGRCL